MFVDEDHYGDEQMRTVLRLANEGGSIQGMKPARSRSSFPSPSLSTFDDADVDGFGMNDFDDDDMATSAFVMSDSLPLDATPPLSIPGQSFLEQPSSRLRFKLKDESAWGATNFMLSGVEIVAADDAFNSEEEVSDM